MSGTLPTAAAKPLSLPRNLFTPTPATLRPTCRASVNSFTGPDSTPGSGKSACPYEILRIKPNASPVEIKSAYRNLAKRYHPDSPSQSESGGQRFIEIHDAYITLSDPAARSVYDSSLEVQQRIGTFANSVGNRTGLYPTRRWETDQCW